MNGKGCGFLLEFSCAWFSIPRGALLPEWAFFLSMEFVESECICFFAWITLFKKDLSLRLHGVGLVGLWPFFTLLLFLCLALVLVIYMMTWSFLC